MGKRILKFHQPTQPILETYNVKGYSGTNMILDSNELEKLQNSVICRNIQLELLNSYISRDPLLNPSGIEIHGSSSTGKSYVIRQYLDFASINYSWITCTQSVTPRILFQKAMKSICMSIDPGWYTKDMTAVENFTVFASMLEQLFKNNNYNELHVLVLDHLDKAFDDSGDLFNCFMRINEMVQIPNLLTIFIIDGLQPKALIGHSIPQIWFPRYTKDQILEIMAKNSPDFSNTDLTIELWSSFCSLIYDSLGAYTGSDVRLLKQVINKIWPQFIQPIQTGQLKPSQIVKLYKACEPYLSSEYAVRHQLVSSTNLDNIPQSSQLPIQSKYLLCAAYLASYNPAQFDIRFFSKAKEARAKRRDTSRRKSLKIDPRSLAAPTFEMERMLAIWHSIYPEEDFISNTDIGVQIATLTVLRLIVRTSSTNPLDSRTKWKTNTGWDFIQKIAKEIDFNINDYIME